MVVGFGLLGIWKRAMCGNVTHKAKRIGLLSLFFPMAGKVKRLLGAVRCISQTVS